MGKNCEQIDLGDTAKDDVTGFEGVVVCVTHWLHGCDRIGVQPQKLDKDNKPLDAITFDRLQMSLVKKNVVTATPRALLQEETGGPTPNAVGRPQTKF